MLSENIHALRRKSGLSQERLAEKIGVSRQAISKWETGAATPELDKLRALCSCFGVTLDELTGEAENRGKNAPERPSPAIPSRGRLGIVLCFAGAVCLALYGTLLLLRPAAAERLSESSTVTLDGSGLLLLVFVLLMAAGAALIFRKK